MSNGLGLRNARKIEGKLGEMDGCVNGYLMARKTRKNAMYKIVA